METLPLIPEPGDQLPPEGSSTILTELNWRSSNASKGAIPHPSYTQKLQQLPDGGKMENGKELWRIWLDDQ